MFLSATSDKVRVPGRGRVPGYKSEDGSYEFGPRNGPPLLSYRPI